MWIVVKGGAFLLHLSVRQGGFDKHTRLQNKDLPAQIRYSSIKSHGSLVRLEKVKFLNFSIVYICLISIRNLTHISIHLAIGLHQIKYKSHIPSLSNYAQFREKLEGNHDV